MIESLSAVSRPSAAPPPEFFTLPAHAGYPYYEVLKWLHMVLQPRTYFEVGSATGISLRLAQCASVAVDPHFQLQGDVTGGKPACELFETTSDAFFAEHDPAAVLGAPVDLAFLDGMHEFEFLLRDVVNTERSCSPESVIVLHDCLPTDGHQARRYQHDDTLAANVPNPGWWAGDLWKAVVILQRMRPDLRLLALDSPPTGLVVVTGLDPASAVPMAEYMAAAEAMRDDAFTEAVARDYFGSLPWHSARGFDAEALLAAFPDTAIWRSSGA